MSEFENNDNILGDGGTNNNPQNTQPQNTNEPQVIPVQPQAPVQQPDVQQPIQPIVQQTVVPDPFAKDSFAPPPVPPVPPIPVVINPIEYTPVSDEKRRKGSSIGLKFFCIAVALMLLVTGSALGGYLYGKGLLNSVNTNDLYKKIELDLASKPKDTDQYTAAQVYEQLNKSIVGICIYNENGEMSQASGVVYTEDGYIVTNDHIYAKVSAPKFKIYAYDGTEYNAVYVSGDVVSDLAVLKITDGEGFAPAVFGDSNELFCGEHVVALGRPSGASDYTTVTSGIISLTARRVSNNSNYSARLIQTDSAINPGSSGGALVNMYGQVIGITSSKLASSNYDNIGFAIPTTTMKRVVTQLIKDGKVTDRAKLGITYTELNSVTAEISGAPAVGIYVATVSSDSDLYGKVAEGDIITKINGKEITSDDIVLDIVEDCRAGDTVTITVVDEDGGETEYDVKLGANVSQSSYSKVLESKEESNDSSGGTFDFPYGE